MKKYLLILLILIFASCGRNEITENEITENEIQISEREVTETEITPHEPSSEIVTWISHSRRLTRISGIVTSISGPISSGGVVPWDAEWVEIEIERHDGTPATIVGMHGTVFIFEAAPQLGTELVAIVYEASPIFTNAPQMFIAVAIVAGISPDSGVTFCCDADAPLSFVINDATILTHTYQDAVRQIHMQSPWTEPWYVANTLAEWLSYLHDSHVIILFDQNYNEIPIARHIFIPCEEREIPFLSWHVDAHGFPDALELTFLDYIFPLEQFEILNLPLLANGVEITAPPPILSADGTVLVPFREVFASGIGFGNYAYVDFDGNLRFGGGGGGSENSHWQIGRAEIHGMAWYYPLCTPPIIVDGFIYVPLLSGIGNAPFASAWVFPDRLEAFSAQLLGSWLEYDNGFTISAEELASFPIFLNGTEIFSHHAILSEFRDILVPAAIFAGMDDEFDEWLLTAEVPYVQLQHLPHGLHAIVYDGRILIESR
jgi:hypothetical protein